MSTPGDILQLLGLAKNEAKIYETLLKHGQSSASTISKLSKIERRNVYDAIKRLIEKGLIFRSLEKNESFYKPVDPKKLNEILQEKQQALDAVMPHLEALYQGNPHQEESYIYRGIEGFKNYIRDVLTVGENLYALGVKNLWTNRSLRHFLPSMLKEIKQKGIQFYYLYDHELKNSKEIASYPVEHHRFLPPSCSTKSTIDIFGDRVVIFSRAEQNTLEDDIILTVLINQHVADAFRVWFKQLWEISSH